MSIVTLADGIFSKVKVDMSGYVSFAEFLHVAAWSVYEQDVLSARSEDREVEGYVYDFGISRKEGRRVAAVP